MEAIREIIHRPQDWARLPKSLPESFLGKDLEVIIVPVIASESSSETMKSVLELRGALQQYAKPERMKAEKEAWKSSVRDELQ